jgi:hypothetical protein
MHWTIVSAAGRAVEAAAHGEVDMDVEPTGRRIEVAAGYRPWRHKTQCQLQQAGVAHDGVSAVAPVCPSVALCSPPSRTLRTASWWPCGHP